MIFQLSSKKRNEDGFSLLELLIVLLIAVIMSAGMVGLLFAAFRDFNQQRSIQAMNDVSRKTFSVMSRQTKDLIHLDNASSRNALTFSGEITGELSRTAPDINNYGSAVVSTISFSRSSPSSQVMETITPPGGNANQQALGSYVSDLRFYYFVSNVQPPSSSSEASLAGVEYSGTDKNYNVGLIRMVLVLTRGTLTRTYYNDVALRTVGRPKAP